jgi:SAM-dependent methyltransferase
MAARGLTSGPAPGDGGRTAGHPVVQQAYWDRHNEAIALRYDPAHIVFAELFDRYVPPAPPDATCFEVGCYPGNFLIHFGRRFGYRASGIDATPLVLDRMRRHLEAHAVVVQRLYQGDFFTFDPSEQCELVCSFGFVEHFERFEDVLERHVALVKPGGLLIVSCPNFRGLQYVLHRALDGANLQRHVLPSMNVRRWRRVLTARGMQVVHDGCYGTMDFWCDSPARTLLQTSAARVVRRAAQALDRRLHWPNRLTSPHLISISRKPAP